MAAVSSSNVTASFSINPSRKFTSLSSSSSVFFSYNITNRTGLGLDVGRPRTAKRRGLSCNCLFGLGVPELAVIAGVAALVFGPKQLPEVGRSFGKTIKSFQQLIDFRDLRFDDEVVAAKEFETELKKDTTAEEPSSGDKITTGNEENQQEAKVPRMK
ncbi:hypothetical protein DH2020_023660 [Rehmannia glutinosa]|uniref:Uncharacterized protein n=1 Tax=Rehmannia glutinosa TaxID=99300 RepID=A0ABR0W6P7_REHGL